MKISNANKGFVYIVGAGPGDPDLLTIKAVKALQSADVVVYDNLVNKDLLQYIKPPSVLIYAGKQSANHTLKQDQINDLLYENALKGSIVVRLKGGDPYIFGRGGEEAEFLAERNIPFEVIPGISSAVAAPAFAGIPLTYRNISSGFMVLTGHEDPLKSYSSVDWEYIAKFNGTIVILMGISNISDIVNSLIKGGMDIDMPCMAVQNGTLPFQKSVISTLSEIDRIIVSNNIKPPAILVIGNVVNLAKKLSWFEKKPLFGKNILLTRPINQLKSLKDSLSELGANIISFPTIQIEQIDDYSLLDQAIININKFDWVVFTSVNGVLHFMNRLKHLGYDSRWLKPVKIASIGSVTSNKLSEYSIKSDFMPSSYLSELVITELDSINQVKGQSFLLPRADIAPDDLENRILSAGGRASSLDIYRTTVPVYTENFFNEVFMDNKIDLILFTSASTVNNFFKILSDFNYNDFNQFKYVSIGPVTTSALLKYVNNVDIEAEIHTSDGLVDIIRKYYT